MVGCDISIKHGAAAAAMTAGTPGFTMEISSKLILVGGCWRTGTSLAQQVICSSPDANPAINECQYLLEQLRIYARFIGSDRIFVDDYFDSTESYQNFTKSIIEKFLLDTYLHLNSPKTLVLKNPGITAYFSHVAALLPGMRFVICVRDPKDTIASIIKVSERQKQNDVVSFFTMTGRDIGKLCNAYNSHYVSTINSLNNDTTDLRKRVLFIRYEDLINETSKTVAGLSRFCGVSLDRFDKNAPRRTATDVTKVAQHPHWGAYLTDLSGKPISANSIGKYKSVLTLEEASEIDQHCARMRQMFKYT